MKVMLEKSAFAGEIPLDLQLWRDGSLVDQLVTSWSDFDFGEDYWLEDNEALTLCDVNSSCSFDYRVEVHNLATGDDDAIESTLDVYVDLWNLDDVYGSPNLDIDID